MTVDLVGDKVCLRQCLFRHVSYTFSFGQRECNVTLQLARSNCWINTGPHGSPTMQFASVQYHTLEHEWTQRIVLFSRQSLSYRGANSRMHLRNAKTHAVVIVVTLIEFKLCIALCYCVDFRN